MVFSQSHQGQLSEGLSAIGLLALASSHQFDPLTGTQLRKRIVGAAPVDAIVLQTFIAGTPEYRGDHQETGGKQ